MDRSWIDMPRYTIEFREGFEKFVTFIEENAPKGDSYCCPCKKCCNNVKLSIMDLRAHIFFNGFMSTYREWIWHGEIGVDIGGSSIGFQRENSHEKELLVDEPFHMHDTELNNENIQRVGDDEERKMIDNLVDSSQKPLYPDCTKYTVLKAVLELFNLKVAHGWSDKSFTALLELLRDILPDENLLPDSNYEAKKIICPMGVESYKKIHACINDCILYRNEYKDLLKCPKCNTPRYKSKKKVDFDQQGGSPVKVIWYLPIKDRLVRMFANARDAENLVWHAEKRKDDGVLRHPADAPQWKTFVYKNRSFSNEARNLRLGLCTDGFNPFGSLSSQHSSWPVLLVIYNLPPWLCMKRKYVMLSLLIPGPKQPGNDIDVYLAPLVDDLVELWDRGVSAFDAYRKEYFTLRAMLLFTINDFPAYGNLSGYPTKGKKACPICEEGTDSMWLKYGGKYCFLGHRKFLPIFHRYRKMKKAFNGKTEDGTYPRPLSGIQVYDRVKNINCVFGKPNTFPVGVTWKKKSIFWNLPYWKDLRVRHCIDFMHVEKNVCDSLIGTLLNIPGKTKDGVKARKDLVDMNIRTELGPQERGQRTFLPPACYTLSRQEKTTLCRFLSTIKVPQGYSSNISSRVSMKDLKLIGMKSHDCHVLMEEFLPIAIRSILPNDVRKTITALCFFFKAICSKTITVATLDALQAQLVVTLCQLEMYFPPSFFDIMVHLVVHLVDEVRFCGPVYLRYMYPFERFMGVLKRYNRNRFRPDASIVEGYVAEELIEFSSDYLKNNFATIGIPKSFQRRDDRLDGKGTLGFRVISPDPEMYTQAHRYILQQSDVVRDYLEDHMVFLRQRNRGKSERWLSIEHNRLFVSWFQERVRNQLAKNPTLVNEDVKWLAYGPSINVVSYEGYYINGYYYYTKRQDEKSTYQNSGVSVDASALYFSKTGESVRAKKSYYGVIEDIWEFDYVQFKVPVFHCNWVDINRGVRDNEKGFTLVNFDKIGHRDEPFVMASQVTQVFYTFDPKDKNWSIVCQGKRVGDYEDYLVHNGEDEETHFSQDLSYMSNHDETDDIEVGVREDHNEGLWILDDQYKNKNKVTS